MTSTAGEAAGGPRELRSAPAAPARTDLAAVGAQIVQDAVLHLIGDGEQLDLASGRLLDLVELAFQVPLEVLDHVRMSADLDEAERHGEWMGLLKLAPQSVPLVRREIERLLGKSGNERAELATLLSSLAAQGRAIQVAYTTGNWLDVDTLYDVIDAERFS